MRARGFIALAIGGAALAGAFLAWRAIASNADADRRSEGSAEPLVAPPPPEREPWPQVKARVAPALNAALKKKGLRLGAPIFIRLFKEEKLLELWFEKSPGTFALFKSYPIHNDGKRGLGPKLREGDGRAPEGFYFVTPALMKPDSDFHLAFNLGYPNAYDQAHGRTGSYLMVHGDVVSVGCYAMTDPQIEEIYTAADAAFAGGQKFFRVHCFPFRLTPERLVKAREDGGEWLDFWENLKEGYDRFEMEKSPPNAEVKDGRYVFP